MSEEWTSVRIRKVLQDAVEKTIEDQKNPVTGAQKYRSVAAFVEEVLEEKLKQLTKEARKN